MVLVKLWLLIVVLSSSICQGWGQTGTYCESSRSRSVQECCHLNNSVKYTSVEADYKTYRNGQESERPWNLTVTITWRNTPENRSTRYAVNLALATSPEDIESGMVPTDLIRGACSYGVNPYKYEDYPPESCAVPETWDILDDAQYSKGDLLFGFSYRLLIREYDGVVASGYTTCLIGFFDPPLETPDCLQETGDEEFCRNQPILVSGKVVNMRVLEIEEEVSDLNVPSLSIGIFWQPPIQLNGNVSFYVVRIFNEDQEVFFDRIYPNENNTDGITIEAEEVPPSREEYELQIQPHVILSGDIFDFSFGTTINNPYYGPVSSLFFSYQPTIAPPVPTPAATDDIRVPDMNTEKLPDPVDFQPLVIAIASTIGGLLSALALVYATYKCLSFKRRVSPPSVIFEPGSMKHIKMKNDDNLPDLRIVVEPEFRSIEILNACDNIILEQRIGSGNYGVVYKGKAILQGKSTWEEVAVKKPKTDSDVSGEAVEEFKSEIRMMLDLGKHPKILHIRGCCTVKEPYYLLTDFMEYGDLLHFLRKCDSHEDRELSSIYKLSALNQIQIAAQIADGMTYVSTTKYFHGDLAARNILVGRDLLIKITDFGFTTDLYELGRIELDRNQKRPYKWYGPESYRDGYCTAKTDVWSFGVVLWEIYTFGKLIPYPGLTGAQAARKVMDGYRLPKPEGCHPKVYEIMRRCWNDNPDARPPFVEIFDAFTVILERIGDEYFELEANEPYQTLKAMRGRRPSLADSIGLINEDYSTWSSITSDPSVFSGESLMDDTELSGAAFTPIVEETREDGEESR